MHYSLARHRLPHCTPATTAHPLTPSQTDCGPPSLPSLSRSCSLVSFSSSLCSYASCPAPSACAHFRNCCIVRSAHLNALQVQPTVRGQPLGCVLVSLGLPPLACLPARLAACRCWLTFAEPLLDATLNSRGVNRVTNQPNNRPKRPTDQRVALATNCSIRTMHLFIYLFREFLVQNLRKILHAPNGA